MSECHYYGITLRPDAMTHTHATGYKRLISDPLLVCSVHHKP